MRSSDEIKVEALDELEVDGAEEESPGDAGTSPDAQEIMNDVI